jgi:hypothetical protein
VRITASLPVVPPVLPFALPACLHCEYGPPSITVLGGGTWQALGVKFLARLNMAQRVIIVIALGVSLMLLGYWIAFSHTVAFGWVAYAPLTRTTHSDGLTLGWDVLIWIGLTIFWAVVSGIVFHRPKAE